jgi:dihydrofolate synthase/folylpolyglutamate synthase
MEMLAELAGNPQKCAPSIHVAGSKGKGSVTAMLSAMLTAAGYRAARYMSPHVVDIRERICLGDSYFSEEVYCLAGNDLREITEERLPAAKNLPHPELFDTATEDGCEPTYFELLTLLFFLCARLTKCDVMVVETGMGGRLDSTNILDPLVSIITLIELEHTGFLGNTVEKVAAEKAGIVKKGRPLILAKQCDEALEVFKKKTKEMGSSLLYFPEVTELSDINISTDGTDFAVLVKNHSRKGAKAQRELISMSLRASIPIPGKVQAENAALAIAALKTAFPQIGDDAVKAGLKNLKLPARFEKVSENPPFIIDGAHTPESLALCVETFCSLYGEGGILIFGCAADKDASAMAKIAHSHFSKIIITTPGTFKISNPAETYEAFTTLTGKEKTLLIPDTQEAITKALSLSSSPPILGTGSFYLVAEIRKIIYDS